MYSGLFLKQIDVECDKTEMERSSPLIYNRCANFSGGKKEEMLLPGHRTHLQPYLSTHGNFENVFLSSFLKITSLISIYISVFPF